MKFLINIFKDEDEVFIAECPSIPGCVSQGKTERDAEKNIQEAFKEYIEARVKEGIPVVVETKQIEVEL